MRRPPSSGLALQPCSSPARSEAVLELRTGSFGNVLRFRRPKQSFHRRVLLSMSRSTRSILLFLGKMLAAYAAWYALYDLWLLPDGRLDAWVSHSVAEVSGCLLSAFGIDPAVQGRSVALLGVPGVRIADGCNGLSTIGLFVGFVVAYPGRWTRRLTFLPLGMAAIYATNVGRIAVMAVVQKHWPAAFGPLHGFGLTTIFYVAVFGLWVLWANYGGVPRSSDAEGGAEAGTEPAVA